MGNPEGFGSRTERVGDRIVVRWAGEIDLATAERANATLDELSTWTERRSSSIWPPRDDSYAPGGLEKVMRAMGR